MPLKKKSVKKKKKTSRVSNFFKNNILFVRNYVCSWRFVVFIWVLFVGMCLCYVFLFFSAAKVQTAITFPGTDINLKEITNHPAGLIVAQNVAITAPDGNIVSGLYIDNSSERVVYYFHGNGAPIEYFYSDIQYISDLGFSVIALEFPGYGKSSGSPTQEQNHIASQLFYEEMKTILEFKDENLIVWGYSVGTALAIDFAQDMDFNALVLFSPLSSRYDMSSKYFGIPLQKFFFLPDSYVSKESIKGIDEPTLIIHGNSDSVVPFWQGELVYENSISQQKYFIEIDDFGHSLIPERYGDVLHGYITNFLTYFTLEEQKVFLNKNLATKLLEKFQKEKYIQSLDLVSDTSLTKYVDPSISFTEKGYIPQDLRSLDREYIVDTKGNAQMTDLASYNLETMAKEFYEEFGEKMVVVSTYRSYAYQAGIKARGCPDNLCAKAGHSEHQSGLAVDFWSASTKSYWDSSERLTKFYSWLKENAHMYGFHNTYQNGREVDGYEIEPWHWRYVGTAFAAYLNEREMTFAEFYYTQ